MSLLVPDFLILILAFGIFALDLLKVPAKVLWNVAWLSLTGIFVLLNTLPAGMSHEWMGAWELNNLGLLLREFFVFSALVVTLLTRRYFFANNAQLKRLPEFLFALLVVTFGSIVVVSAKELLTLFVGLELATIPLYFLVAWNKRCSLSGEASTKYILLGSASTAMMLFGLSYLYGFTGSLNFDVIKSQLSTQPLDNLFWTSAIFIIVGIGFKLALFPFHAWAPDVYEGAPTPVTAFLSVSSKATAIAFLTILLYGPLAPIHKDLDFLLLLLAAVTMLVGNLGALRQSRLKRFMAWSSIAQAGYILTALVGPANIAKPAIVFYLFVYAFSNYLMFWIISILESTRPTTFSSLQGLAKQYPALGAALAVTLFSLAGIPPVAGFIGKLFLFGSAANAGYYVFIIYAALNSTISLYYYLQVMRAAYVTPGSENPQALAITGFDKGVSLILTLLVLLAGFAPWLSNNIHTILQTGP